MSVYLQKVIEFMDKRTKTFERITDNHVFFWGGPLSNWFPCHMQATIDGDTLEFHNTEQYFMYMKAKMFNDEDNQKLILSKGSDPKIAKALGRRVRNYDDKAWAEKRFEFMKDANRLKFTQNPELKLHILSEDFKGKHFVEGSPYDCIWGIGVHWTEANDDKSNWIGENLLGKCLDEIREEVVKNP